jgi:predicted GTPase
MFFSRFGFFIGVVFLLPWLALIGVGGYWLWQHDWLYYAVGILSANFALVYLLIRWSNQPNKPTIFEPIVTTGNPNWSALGHAAWAELEGINAHWQNETDVLTNSSKVLALSNEVLTKMARHFHPDATHPILEFPLPYLLKLVTLVCNDIQHEVLDKIPGSHAIKVGDLLRAKQAVETLNKFKSLFNVGNWLFNWPGAAMAKARGILLSKGVNTVANELSQHLIRAYIDKLGYYAIELYSGQISLDDNSPTERLSPKSEQNLSAIAEREQHTEPLRLLLIGQVSSGKSSLINALIGEMKCAASPLPTTSNITAHLLEREGLQQVILLDTPGYGGLTPPHASMQLKNELNKVDVILLVCNASHASRAEDAKQLDSIRQYFQTECTNQALPVIIAVVTHIDRLRPLQEWQPPYNILSPDNTKASNIQHVCVAIAQELALPVTSLVPVCLAADKPVYNIEEGLMTLIQQELKAVQQVYYLRCLRFQQAENSWQQWRKQLLNTANTLLDVTNKMSKTL